MKKKVPSAFKSNRKVRKPLWLSSRVSALFKFRRCSDLFHVVINGADRFEFGIRLWRLFDIWRALSIMSHVVKREKSAARMSGRILIRTTRDNI